MHDITRLDAKRPLAECPVLMRRTAPFQRHRDVLIRNIYGPTAGYILAFAERPLMANNGHRRSYQECPLLGVKRT